MAKKYSFLLKGHEDTRLDERVMQLFRYTNRAIQNCSVPLKSQMILTVYKVLPLSPNFGLIGWVPNSSTVHQVIQSGRSRRNIPLDFEISILKKYANNYDFLEQDEKYELFQKCINETPGDDLKVFLLSQSKNSSHWIRRRLNFMASLASMNMVGYILGLGDRHLSNLMVEFSNCSLFHIDFGDCFEVAMNRKEFPEKVPFRLTRILVNAFEVSGVEGTYRACSESSIRLLREHNDQIMSLLEVFVCDPLFQWESNSNAAIQAISRIHDKLTGNDFEEIVSCDVTEQVRKLIRMATDQHNLCEMFSGWAPWQ